MLLLGGTSDIALATAEQYARRRPLRIVLAARPSERLEAAAERLRGTGSTVTTVPFDARNPDTHADTLDKAFADGDIDISLVAFGTLGDQEELWTDVEAAREMAEINYVAPVTVGVLLAERMRKQGHGHIVALSSVAGERVRRSNFAYGSSKAGMDGFYTGLTEALRPSGVKVTVVRPGHVKSKMTEGMKEAPLAQTPEQVARIIVDSVRKGRELVWAPAQFRYVMSVLRHLPRAVFRRLPF
nr:decaprenylphospho-beta-D-erythro-pentofuranosid-2-ulose 2-reductase [Actinopolyspora biskrensis]